MWHQCLKGSLVWGYSTSLSTITVTTGEGTSAAGEPDHDVRVAVDVLVADQLGALPAAGRADEVEAVDAQQRVAQRHEGVAVRLGAGAERAMHVLGADRLLRVLLVVAEVVERLHLERIAGLRRRGRHALRHGAVGGRVAGAQRERAAAQRRPQPEPTGPEHRRQQVLKPGAIWIGFAMSPYWPSNVGCTGRSSG